MGADVSWSWSNIDWGATGNWMQAWAGFAGAGAVLYAAYKGVASFAGWLLQKQTERHMIAAEQILTLVYRIRSALEAARSPMHSSFELSEAEKRLSETYDGYAAQADSKKRRLQTGQVVLTRVGSYSELWEEFSRIQPLAKALFGEEADQAFQLIWKQRSELIVTAQMFADVAGHTDLGHKFENAIWRGYSEARGVEDAIDVAMSQAVLVLEGLLIPLLRSVRFATPGVSAKNADSI